MGVVAAEAETWRQWLSQSPKPIESFLSAGVARDLELTVAGDADLDIITVLQPQSLNDC